MILEDVVLFPQMMLPLYIFETRYRQMLTESLGGSRMFCVARKRPEAQEECPERVAGIGLVRVALDHENGSSHLVLQGLTRVMLKSVGQFRTFPNYEIKPLETKIENEERLHALSDRVNQIARKLLDGGEDNDPCMVPVMTSSSTSADGQDDGTGRAKILEYLRYLDDPEQIGDLIASSLIRSCAMKQQLLTITSLEDRLDYLAKCLIEENRLPLQ